MSGINPYKQAVGYYKQQQQQGKLATSKETGETGLSVKALEKDKAYAGLALSDNNHDGVVTRQELKDSFDRMQNGPAKLRREDFGLSPEKKNAKDAATRPAKMRPEDFGLPPEKKHAKGSDTRAGRMQPEDFGVPPKKKPTRNAGTRAGEMHADQF